jgi:hypothetical protein
LEVITPLTPPLLFFIQNHYSLSPETKVQVSSAIESWVDPLNMKNMKKENIWKWGGGIWVRGAWRVRRRIIWLLLGMPGTLPQGSLAHLWFQCGSPAYFSCNNLAIWTRLSPSFSSTLWP